MIKISSLVSTLLLVTTLFFIGIPAMDPLLVVGDITNKQSTSPSRRCTLPFDQLTLSAYGLERDNHWAIVESTSQGQSDAVFEGDVVFGCFKITKVVQNGALVTDLSNGERHTLVLYGGRDTVYESPVEEVVNKSSPEELYFSAVAPVLEAGGFTADEVMQHIQFNDVGPNITNLTYSKLEEKLSLPSTVYWNKEGDAFFDNPENIGIGQSATQGLYFNNQTGLRLGQVPTDSLLGRYGLEEGDVIAMIGGSRVTSPEDAAKYLRSSVGSTVEVAYAKAGTTNAIICDHLVILNNPA